MWRLALSLTDTCVYPSKRILFAGAMRATVKSIYVRGKTASSGYVAKSKTRPIFRTESSRFIILIQMSKEMWEFEEDGELMFSKAIDGFLPELFDRWKLINAQHLVTIVLFTRVLYYDEDPLSVWDSIEFGSPRRAFTVRGRTKTRQASQL